ncbi:hypothetical protein PVK06_046930 [Gossypium arboreum]|uniref:RNase H type-1 domain-containing protein n=1 Tax=Gossypium arboreum TaxID=29729 RepID=A0ABR0MC04_GOSAR|nr:hypothetical protein PVK06_046930 [Gossypium arboreum]
MAAIQATTFAADLGFMHVVSEGDSLMVIKKLTSPNEDRWEIRGGDLFFSFVNGSQFATVPINITPPPR